MPELELGPKSKLVVATVNGDIDVRKYWAPQKGAEFVPTKKGARLTHDEAAWVAETFHEIMASYKHKVFAIFDPEGYEPETELMVSAFTLGDRPGMSITRTFANGYYKRVWCTVDQADWVRTEIEKLL